MLGNLSLEIAKGYAPFELVGREVLFKAEDWAWQFLRLSPGYQQAYATASERQRENPESRDGAGPWPKVKFPHRNIFVDEAICRKRFGLSTWLAPEQTRLPPLNTGGSWFAPLKSVVWWPESIQGGAVHEGIFGFGCYQSPPAFKGIQLAPRRSSAVWFAVDCSVPPDAQLKSIRYIAQQYATQLRDAGFTSNCVASRGPLVKTLVGDGNFNGEDYQYAAAPADRLENPAELWRLVRIDVLGAQKAQIDKCRALLLNEHSRLCKQGMANPPEQQRLRLNLGSTKGKTGDDHPTDGHALKAYVLVAQCYLGGMADPDDIVQFINGLAFPKDPQQQEDPQQETDPQIPRTWDEWVPGQTNRFEGYIEKARVYVSGRYRWLIYAQKP